METGIELIEKEYNRQTNEEGYTTDHDDEHENHELARAAASYALPVQWRQYGNHNPEWYWPWFKRDFKPTPDDRVKELVKAGALIAKEIDRLKRLEQNGETV